LAVTSKDVSVYLASTSLRIRGEVDEILYSSDGTLAPLDYKYSEYSEYLFRTHKVQSVLYALLIMKNFNKVVKRGLICYIRSNNKIKEISYSEKDFSHAKELIKEIFDVILKGFYPKMTHWSNRCIDCCYKNICVQFYI